MTSVQSQPLNGEQGDTPTPPDLVAGLKAARPIGIDEGTPAHALIEAVRTSFYRCESLPPAIFEAVKEYEAANQPCDCSCHRTDDHCDRCCEFRLCEDCRAYSERS